jgi:DNA-binding MarR family transcriptional regulator
MPTSSTKVAISQQTVQVLAEFRYQLRLFLHFSETAAGKVGLKPQQHQLLLQIAGAPAGVVATVGFIAKRLQIRHNTAVELAARCEQRGLLKRVEDEADRRCVSLQLTAKGRGVLTALSVDHTRELNELAPKLVETLAELKKTSAKAAAAEQGRNREK